MIGFLEGLWNSIGCCSEIPWGVPGSPGVPLGVLEMCSGSPWDVLGCHLGTLGTSLVVRGCPEDPGDVLKIPMGRPWMSLERPRTAKRLTF